MAQIIVDQPDPINGANLINNVPGAVLTYNGVLLYVTRTDEWYCEPDLDYAGVDYCLNHIIVIGVRAIVSPAATATITGQNPPPLVGDRAGVTMQNLQQILMVPRQQLVYQIGNDVVVLSPQSATFDSDAKRGPKPLSLRIIEVYGTKACLIFFRIETWIGGNKSDPTANPAVLSNRWSVSASVDDDWKTTITTRGRMRVRTDVLDTISPETPDIFRQAVLPLPIPDGFRRTVPEILVTPDGSELAWTCVDREQVLNLGANSPATRVTGQYTTGADVPYRDMKNVMKSGFGIATSVSKGDIFGALGAVFQNFVPSVKNSFQFRVHGPVGASRQNLLNVALRIAIDRFAPLFRAAGADGITFGNPFAGGATLVSLYATISIDQMWVELRGEILGTLGQAGNAFDPANIASNVNLSNDIAIGGGLAFVGSTPAPNPNPPNANTSRGTYIGGLLEQSLKGTNVFPFTEDSFALPDNNAESARGAAAVPIDKNFQ